MKEKIITKNQLSCSLEKAGTLTAQVAEAAAQDIAALTPQDIGAVPTTRKVNGKALGSDISLSASDVGAATSSHTHTASQVGARPSTWTPTAADVGAVPTTRKVNGKALNTDISLTASDVGASASSHTHTAAQVGARPSTWTPTASDVKALPITGGTLTGNLTIKGSGNYGTKINLGDGDLVHLAEPSDDVLEIKAKSLLFETMSQASTKPLPVNQGGTGASTAAAALTALGAASSSHSHTASQVGAVTIEQVRQTIQDYISDFAFLGRNWWERKAIELGAFAAQAIIGARGTTDDGKFTVDVYIATENGSPSIALLQKVYNALKKYNASETCGSVTLKNSFFDIDIQTYAPLTQNIDITVRLATCENVEFTVVKERVEQALRNFFNGKLLGKELRLAELGSLIDSVDGVENYKIIKPSSNQPAQIGLLPILKILTVTQDQSLITGS